MAASASSGSVPGQATLTNSALLLEPMTRPMTSMVPSRRTSSVAARSGTPIPSLGLVDVMTVAPRADVAARVERRAAQRTRRATRRPDVCGTCHEGPRGSRSEPDPQQVGAIVVLVVVLVGVDRLAVFVLGARLDQHSLGVGVPAEGQRACTEGFDQRLVKW